MRIFTYLTLIVAMTFSTMSQAGIVFAFADVSAGVFRFQVKLAEQGNSEAQYKVGEMYERGKGVSEDLAQAQLWYEKAAKQGHKKAEYKLLYLEISARGLNDFTRSQLGNIRSEAAAGNADAQYFLGKMYAAGVGVPKSLENALTWLNKAAFNGIAEAEHEAIAIDEELTRIRARENNQRAAALAAAQQKKEDEEKAKQAREAKEREQAARRNEERRREAQKQAEQNRAERARAAQAEKERNQQAKPKPKVVAVNKEDNKADEDESFDSDPCKGKKARFLSTCKN